MMIYMAVHCHVGSLENIPAQSGYDDQVHCHVGSLEKYGYCDTH